MERQRVRPKREPVTPPVPFQEFARAMARPRSPDLTPDLIKRAARLLECDGMFRSDAAWILGVNPKTFDNWLAQGSEEGRKPDDLFVLLTEAARTAEAKLKKNAQASARAEKGGEKWFLACRFPQQYNPDLRRELATAFAQIFGAASSAIGQEQAQKLFDALATNEDWAALLPKMR